MKYVNIRIRRTHSFRNKIRKIDNPKIELKIRWENRKLFLTSLTKLFSDLLRRSEDEETHWRKEKRQGYMPGEEAQALFEG
jgi:hypothetical protein